MMMEECNIYQSKVMIIYCDVGVLLRIPNLKQAWWSAWNPFQLDITTHKLQLHLGAIRRTQWSNK